MNFPTQHPCKFWICCFNMSFLVSPRRTLGSYENVADCWRSMPGGNGLQGRRSCEFGAFGVSRLESLQAYLLAWPLLAHLSFRTVSLLRTCMISLTPSLWALRWLPVWLQCARLWEVSARHFHSECKYCLLQINKPWLWLWLQVRSARHYCCAVHKAVFGVYLSLNGQTQ